MREMDLECGETSLNERSMAEENRTWAQAIAFAYPFIAKALSDFARTYDFEAVMHDADASIRRRLPH